jgi:hypothetical protein
MSVFRTGDIIAAIVGSEIYPHFVRIAETKGDGDVVVFTCVDWKNRYITVPSENAFRTIEGAWSECKGRGLNAKIPAVMKD